ncbi:MULTISPECIES: hypothetical protein, partial [unclassified Azospirillum]|uniref:hypothetical protein n=1 Tax=unclassified Azospirillum TaxID=2630922 RepID=UPI001B3BDEF0
TPSSTGHSGGEDIRQTPLSSTIDYNKRNCSTSHQGEFCFATLLLCKKLQGIASTSFAFAVQRAAAIGARGPMAKK